MHKKQVERRVPVSTGVEDSDTTASTFEEVSTPQVTVANGTGMPSVSVTELGMNKMVNTAPSMVMEGGGGSQATTILSSARVATRKSQLGLKRKAEPDCLVAGGANGQGESAKRRNSPLNTITPLETQSRDHKGSPLTMGEMIASPMECARPNALPSPASLGRHKASLLTTDCWVGEGAGADGNDKDETESEYEREGELEEEEEIIENGVRTAVHLGDDEEEEADYLLTIQPLMGPSFPLTLPAESTIYDLKDAIFVKLGLSPKRQLLSRQVTDLSALEDDKFLQEISLPHRCTINLGVKSRTGLQLASSIGLQDDDKCLVYEVFLPPYHQHSLISSSSSHPLDSQPQEGGNSSQNSSSNEESSSSCTVESDGDEGSLLQMAELTLGGRIISLPRFDPSYLEGGETTAAISSRRSSLLQFESLDALRISLSPEHHYNHHLNDSLVTTAIPPPPRPETPTPFHHDLIPRLSKVLSEITREEGEETLSQSNVSSSVSTKTKDEPVLPDKVPSTHCLKCGCRCRPALRFTCRCGGTFCQDHRYYDRHECSFDVCSRDRQGLHQANPKVIKPKLDQL